MNMKQLTISSALAALFSLFLCFTASAQSIGEVIVIEVSNFDSQKNFDIYSLFDQDQEVDVINSCDALGWVVLKAQNEALSKAMVRAYVEMKIVNVLEANSYSIVEDKQPIDVLEDCRAEMLRQSEMK